MAGEVLGGGLSTGGQGAKVDGKNISILDHATQHPEAHKAVAHGTHGHHHKHHKATANGRPNQKNPLAETMSNLMNLANIIGGILKMAKAGTGLQNIGNFANILGKIGQQLGATGAITNLSDAALSSLNSLPNTNELMSQVVDAVGPAGALGLAMLGSTNVDLSSMAEIIAGNPQPSLDLATLPFYNPLSTAPPTAGSPSVDTPAGTLPALDAKPAGPQFAGLSLPPVGDQTIDPPVTETNYADG